MIDHHEIDETELKIMHRFVRGDCSQDDKAKLFALNKIVDIGIGTYQRPIPEQMEDTNDRTQS